MCRRCLARWGVLAAAVMLAVGAMPLRAQTQAEYRARIQQLAPIWRSVSKETQRLDSIQRHNLPTDTVRVDALTVLADSSLDGVARTSASRAAAELRNRFGPAVAALLSHPFTLEPTKGSGWANRYVTVGEVDSLGRISYTENILQSSDLLTGTWISRGSTVLTQHMKPGFRRWLAGAVPVGSVNRNNALGVRIDLVTASTPLARRCYAGDIEACGLALGVMGESDPVRNWFDPAERLAMVRRDAYQLNQIAPKLFSECVKTEQDAVCTAAAEQIPRDGVPPPLGPASRQLLVQLGMHAGGPDAYQRMLTAPDSISAQLRAASGLPTDSLVRIWRGMVVALPAEHTTMTPGLAMMSLFWVTACGALALGSSRWR